MEQNITVNDSYSEYVCAFNWSELNLMEFIVELFLKRKFWTPNDAACILAGLMPDAESKFKKLTTKKNVEEWQNSIPLFGLDLTKFNNLHLDVYKADFNYTTEMVNSVKKSMTPKKWIEYSLSHKWYPRWLYEASKDQKIRLLLNNIVFVTTKQSLNMRTRNSENEYAGIRNKIIIYWEEWMKNPNLYKSRSEFVASMNKKFGTQTNRFRNAAQKKLAAKSGEDKESLNTDLIRKWIKVIEDIYITKTREKMKPYWAQQYLDDFIYSEKYLDEAFREKRNEILVILKTRRRIQKKL